MTTSEMPPSRWRDWGFVLGVFGASRALVAFVAAVAPLWFKTSDAFHGKLADIGWKAYVNVWDVSWYGNVALDGYRFSMPGEGNVAFFPLLPLILRAFHACGIDFLVTGILLSNLCLLAALWMLLRLVVAETGCRRTAELTVSLVAFGPGAPWFSLGMTESLFLVLTLAMATLGTKCRWLAMGAAGVLAGLARPSGFLLALPAVALVWPSAVAAWRAGDRRRVVFMTAAIAGPVVGYALYASYLQWAYGHWNASHLAASHHWLNGMRFTWGELVRRIPAVGLGLFDQPNPYVELIAWSWTAVIIAALLAAIGLWEYRARAWHKVWLATFCGFHAFLFQGLIPVGPIVRYAAVIPAIYLGAALLARKRPWLRPALLAFAASALVLQTALIFCGYHIS